MIMHVQWVSDAVNCVQGSRTCRGRTCTARRRQRQRRTDTWREVRLYRPRRCCYPATHTRPWWWRTPPAPDTWHITQACTVYRRQCKVLAQRRRFMIQWDMYRTFTPDDPPKIDDSMHSHSWPPTDRPTDRPVSYTHLTLPTNREV